MFLFSISEGPKIPDINMLWNYQQYVLTIEPQMHSNEVIIRLNINFKAKHCNFDT